MAGYRQTNSRGVTYFLQTKLTKLRGGREQRIYYFSKNDDSSASSDLPGDRVVLESPRTGFLILRRQAEGQDESLTASPALRLSADGIETVLLSGGLIEHPPGDSSEPLVQASEVLGPLHESGIGAGLRELDLAINDPESKERHLQAILESWPELLSVFGHAKATPHIILETTSGRLIPDFVLTPAEAEFSDILELKIASMKLITYVGKRPQLSRAALAALSQLRNYAGAVQDEKVRESVKAKYGVDFIRPRLYLVAGRSLEISREDLRVAPPSDELQLFTWDDVLERARHRFR